MSIKIINVTHKYSSAFLIILSIFFTTGISHLHAQQSMNGGGYTLNGTVTVFTGTINGNGYSVGQSGDPVVSNNSSGGGFSVQPTAYSLPVTPSLTSGTPGAATAVSFPPSASGTTTDSTQNQNVYQNNTNQGQQNTNNQESQNEFSDNKEVFQQKYQKPQEGSGVSNIDSSKNIINIKKKSGGMFGNMFGKNGASNDLLSTLNTTSVSTVYFYICGLLFLVFFTRVIRISSSTSRYLVSKNVFLLACKHFLRKVNLNKTPVEFLDISKNKDNKHPRRYRILRIIDIYIVSTITLLGAFIVKSASPLLSGILVVALLYRVYIGYQLKKLK
jgi:hypothetical protein